MGATILFFSALGVMAVWWLSKQRLTSKPWLEAGNEGEFPGGGALAVPVAKVGLGVLLAALGSLFALFISAYLMRMQIEDWRPVPKPTILWINTGVLLLSSAALQWACAAADRRDLGALRIALAATVVAAFAFLAGQLIAWRQLTGDGYALSSNPANSFFYLITALHGVHVIGGVVALGLVTFRAWTGTAHGRLRLMLDLSSLYWDFLLLMWLVLFGLLWLT